MAENAIIEIVLTGGPCSGKTSSMAQLVDRLAEHGLRTLVVPEAATMVIGGGIGDLFALAADDRPRYLDIQRQLIGIQTDLRARFQAMARALGGRVVIIYDRGQMDAAAYTSADEFAALMAQSGANLACWRDSYTSVLHLVTAADGAPEFYTTANNAARQESDLAQAIDADRRTLRAWVGHPRLRVFDNRSDFTAKLQAVIGAVLAVAGLPMPVDSQRKFLIEDGDYHPSGAVSAELTQHYLRADDDHELRLRRRQQGHDQAYTLSEKHRLDDQHWNRRERLITMREYATLLAQADPLTLRKRRTSFVYDNVAYRLDRFYSIPRLCILEADVDDLQQTLDLPPVSVIKEVTDNPNFRNASLARNIPSNAR
jgi:CYTH domain-containing protein/predicted ATPase